jgi:hypothetical protein
MNHQKLEYHVKTKSLEIKPYIVRFALGVFMLIALTVAQKANAIAAPVSENKSVVTAMAKSCPCKQKMQSGITVSEVSKAQELWANGLIAIGKAYTEKGNYEQVAKTLINELYAYNYENGVVMFKPTKAKVAPFRKTKESALSYFVGDNAKFMEDKGFALQPWTKVVFHNNEMYFHGDMAIAMGTYDFTDTKGKVVTVEYTFAYVKANDGTLKIVLHHSSAPYSG